MVTPSVRRYVRRRALWTSRTSASVERHGTRGASRARRAPVGAAPEMLPEWRVEGGTRRLEAGCDTSQLRATPTTLQPAHLFSLESDGRPAPLPGPELLRHCFVDKQRPSSRVFRRRRALTPNPQTSGMPMVARGQSRWTRSSQLLDREAARRPSMTTIECR